MLMSVTQAGVHAEYPFVQKAFEVVLVPIKMPDNDAWSAKTSLSE